MLQSLARHPSQADSFSDLIAWAKFASASLLLLISGLYLPVASGDSTFPGQAGQKTERHAAPHRHSDPAAPQLANPNREEIKAEIRSLELERTELLAKFSSLHPDVRALERRLQARRKQLELLDLAPQPAK